MTTPMLNESTASTSTLVCYGWGMRLSEEQLANDR